MVGVRWPHRQFLYKISSVHHVQLGVLIFDGVDAITNFHCYDIIIQADKVKSLDEGGIVDPYFFETVDSIGGERVTDHRIWLKVGLIVFVEGLVLHKIDVFSY